MYSSFSKYRLHSSTLGVTFRHSTVLRMYSTYHPLLHTTSAFTIHESASFIIFIVIIFTQHQKKKHNSPCCMYRTLCGMLLCLYKWYNIYIWCNRRNGPDFWRVFLRSYYTDITQNTYIQSSMVTQILAREFWNFDSYYSLIDYQIHIETGRNMWFL